MVLFGTNIFNLIRCRFNSGVVLYIYNYIAKNFLTARIFFVYRIKNTKPFNFIFCNKINKSLFTMSAVKCYT